MQGFDLYREFVAMKLHFARNSKYDYLRFRGSVKNVTPASFEHNRMRWLMQKMERELRPLELRDFALANCARMDPPSWAGDMSMDVYMAWKKRAESLMYTFNSELKKFRIETIKAGLHPHVDWWPADGKLPVAATWFLRGELSLDTLALGFKTCGSLERMKYALIDDPISERICELVDQYSKFLSPAWDHVRNIMEIVYMGEDHDESK